MMALPPEKSQEMVHCQNYLQATLPCLGHFLSMDSLFYLTQTAQTRGEMPQYSFENLVWADGDHDSLPKGEGHFVRTLPIE